MDMLTTTQGVYEKGKAGDPAALNRLYEIVKGRALAYIERHLDPALRGELEAMDIYQEACLRAHEAFASFQYTTKGAFAKWFYTIINGILQNKREGLHTAKRQEVPLPVVKPKGASTQADENDKWSRIREWMKLLPVDQREVFHLRFVELLSREETAAKLGLSLQTVSNLTTRALKAMKTMRESR